MPELGQGKPMGLNVLIDGKDLNMELDTGAAVSLMSEATFHSSWPGRQLQDRLRAYSKEPLRCWEGP